MGDERRVHVVEERAVAYKCCRSPCRTDKVHRPRWILPSGVNGLPPMILLPCQLCHGGEVPMMGAKGAGLPTLLRTDAQD